MYIMKKSEEETVHYLSVESRYFNVREAQGKEDAVLFEMGQFNKRQEVDAIFSVSVEEARNFAEAILKQCSEIERGW